MSDQPLAKRKFRNLLALLLVTLFWPIIAILFSALLAIAGLKSLGLIGVALLVIWVALTVWLFVRLWQTAREVGTTPWATFWLILPIIGAFIVAMLFLEPLKHQADGKPENRRLPLTWKLIKETWTFYSENFKSSARISVWYLYAYIIVGVLVAAVDHLKPDLLPYFSAIIVLPMAFFSLWVMLNLFFRNLNAEQKTDGRLERKGKKYLSYLWIIFQVLVISAGPFILSLLIVVSIALLVGGWQSVVSSIMPDAISQPSLASMNLTTFLIVAVVGIVLAIPTWLWLVYKSTVWNSLVLPVFLIQGKTGHDALKECNRLAKGRWWGLFWKSQLAGLVFGSYSMLISLGMSVAALLLAALFRSLNTGSLISDFFSQVLNGVLQMIVIPLFVAFSLKLYRAFSATAE